MCPPPPAATLVAMNPHPPRLARAAAIIAVLTAAAPLAAACGGSPSSTGSGGSPTAGGSSNSAVPLAYSQCMRSHGIANFPDPGGNGQISKEKIIQLQVSGPRLQAAQSACIHLWPYQPPTQAQQRQQIAAYLKFTQCMRAHGVPGFPTPSVGHGGRVEFALSMSRDGFNPHSPQILAKAHGCEHVLGAGSGLPEVTESP
jgi:hypothetical protein